ncbi:FG-GAP repeat domain-containing protein [Flavivirga spongiicola]|uniref:VCBS repeat-containing protein n=1 Tax=Flavivirga spongiicola TaxID=421621 RepID=A0ABU7XZ24_9FLAO|nr:VCBS repeat-containing protein [Flavivirga sp. MEBiC05379]MDO5980822.1 VCBS repeat-containing protein [Flavivirga sp. MEBiC05379]
MKKTGLLAIAFMTIFSTYGQIETTVFEQPYRLKADGKIIDVVETGHSAPFIYDYNNDGKDDLLVGYFGKERSDTDLVRGGHHLTKGGCNIYLNMGTNENPEYTFTGKLLAGGKQAYVPTDCCVGFVPRVADLDGDGIDDILSGSYPGQAYFYKGIGEGMYKAYQFLRDKTGKAMNPDHTTTITPFDWDEDGDLDLVWGVRFKGTFVSFNTGSKTAPQFEAPKHIEMEKYGDKKMYELSSHSVPIDWDGDGHFDLVCGSEQGDVFWYKNIGKKGSPKFGDPEMLIINNKRGHRTLEGDNSKPHGTRCKVFPYDYNNDGKLDLLIGDTYSTADKAPKLTPEQEIGLEELQSEYIMNPPEEINELNAKCAKFANVRYKELMDNNADLTETEARGLAWMDLPEDLLIPLKKYYKKAAEDLKDYFKLKSGQPYSHGYVWVYIRK